MQGGSVDGQGTSTLGSWHRWSQQGTCLLAHACLHGCAPTIATVAQPTCSPRPPRQGATPACTHAPTQTCTCIHAARPAPRPRPPPLSQGNGDLLFNGVHQVQDKGYAFVEFRSVEEASNAMALDGVKFRDAYLKVGGGGGLVS